MKNRAFLATKTFQAMKNKKPWKFRLQLFADDGSGDGTSDGTDDNNSDGDGGTDGDDNAPDGGDGDDGQKKYTDEDLDRIIEKKLSKWQKQQAKKVSEAEKLASRNAEKKSEDRIKDLEDKLSKYEKEQAHTQMMAQARRILHDEHINVSDNLLTNFVTDEADSTEDNIKEFIKLFRDEVSKAVKDQLKGSAPKKGSGSKITKEDIEKVKNPIERQKLIRENMDLFRS